MFIHCIAGMLLGVAALQAQAPPGQLPPSSQQSSPGSTQGGPQQIQIRQNSPPSASIPAAFQGGIPTGQATDADLALTIEDALARGLKYNLGVVQGNLDTRFERSNRLRALSQLLPTLNLRPSITEEQVNLASFGFTGFPGIPSVVGPFTVYDARAFASIPVLNISGLRNYRAGEESVNAAKHTYRDVRDQVTLVITGLYLQANAGASRIETARAQVQTSQSLFQRASDRKTAGTAPAIDVLRAQVELQSQQQRLIFYEGEFEKQKLNLARAIGLPLGQQFHLADPIPYTPPVPVSLQASIDRAYQDRADYQAALSRVKAAEMRKQAARAERLPTAAVDANYGVIGSQINQTHGSFTVQGFVNIPIFQGRRVEADVLEADTELQQQRAQLDDLRGRIDNDVRSAFVDLRSASRQVEVGRSNIDLARQQLEQSQDRFAAGVTNNLEVVQAQQAVAAANESYIASLYSFNVAEAELARAVGGTEKIITEYLKRTK